MLNITCPYSRKMATNVKNRGINNALLLCVQASGLFFGGGGEGHLFGERLVVDEMVTCDLCGKHTGQ